MQANRINLRPAGSNFAAALAALALLLTPAATRDAAAADLPTVDAILTQHIKAAGGETALRRIKTRRLTATLMADMFGKATWELLAKAPNKRLTVTEITGYGTMLDGYDGKVSWSQNPFAGSTVRSGEEAARSAREADFYQDLNLKTLYPNLKVVAATKVGGADTWLLESHPSSKSRDRFYFSQRTGLLLEHESQFENGSGRTVTKTRFADFRKVDGLVIPHRVELRIAAADSGEFNLQLIITKVEHNLEIPDSKFKRPGA